MLDGVTRLKGARSVATALIASAVIWGIEVVCCWLIGRAVFPVPVAICLILMAVVNFASLFALTIGGVGAIETAATAFLVSTSVPAPEALAIVLIQHGMQLAFTTSLGAYVFLREPGRTRSARAGTHDIDVVREDVIGNTKLGLHALQRDIALAAPPEKPIATSRHFGTFSAQSSN
jgi:hypothetical protein